MKGSERQIEWANTIRNDLLSRIEQGRTRAAFGAYFDVASGDDAKWYIDRRDAKYKSAISDDFMNGVNSFVAMTPGWEDVRDIFATWLDLRAKAMLFQIKKQKYEAAMLLKKAADQRKHNDD